MSITALSQGLVACEHCSQLNYVHTDDVVACGRCGSAVQRRSLPRLGRVWALLFSAVVLYIPANLLPVMTVVSLGKESSNTLIGGVVHFVQTDAWLLALVVFVASILVPLLKMLVLSSLLFSVHFRWCARLRDKTRLYRLVEFIGKWSMVDIFVIALLVALVQFGEFASVQVGAGSLSFAAVVLLTLWATADFDMRWLWDVCEEKEGDANV
jgi:paraquat-inducible protein A